MVERKLRPAPSTLHLLPSRKPAKTGSAAAATKLFVLDTNVLMHDPDEPLPLRGARRLPADGHARGARQQQEGHDARSRATRARRAASSTRSSPRRARRRASRRASPLDGRNRAAPRPAGSSCRPRRSATSCRPSLAGGKADNQILARRDAPQQTHPKRNVILVSKDINMRIKARALGIAAEDYFNDKVLEDTDLLYTGHARAAGGFLGQARQGHGVLAAGRPHVLPRDRPAGAVAAASTSSSTTRAARRRSTRS